MKTNLLVVLSFTLALVAVAAEGDEALVEQSSRGRWTFSAGPSWRSRVKMETRGTIKAASLVTGDSSTYLGDSQNPTADEWGTVHKVATPEKYSPNPGDESYAIDIVRRDVHTVAGSDYRVNSSDEDNQLGLNLQGCYDFYQGETWSVGLNLRFAGYWNMKSSASGYYNGGYRSTQDYNDSYLFMNGPFVWFDDSAPTASDGYLPESVADYSTKNGSLIEETFGSRAVVTRISSDLYQIGIGPKVVWSPFAGWCEYMQWLDVYGGVEVLCNIAYTKFEADRSSNSQTDCLIGFGGNIGIIGNVTDNCGIFGQIGYEWIDDSDVSAGGFKAEVDYSSLVISAGLQLRF